MNRITVHNSRFAKAGVLCFYDSEVLNSSFVHLMKFSAEKPRLRKAAKRYLDTIQGLLKKIISGSGIPKRAILHLSECHPKIN